MVQKIAYLKCEISKGMFSCEKGITITDIFGMKIGGFFPDSVIKNDKLEVIVVKEEGNKALIRPKFECGGYGFINSKNSCIYVYKKLLEYK